MSTDQACLTSLLFCNYIRLSQSSTVNLWIVGTGLHRPDALLSSNQQHQSSEDATDYEWRSKNATQPSCHPTNTVKATKRHNGIEWLSKNAVHRYSWPETDLHHHINGQTSHGARTTTSRIKHGHNCSKFTKKASAKTLLLLLLNSGKFFYYHKINELTHSAASKCWYSVIKMIYVGSAEEHDSLYVT